MAFNVIRIYIFAAEAAGYGEMIRGFPDLFSAPMAKGAEDYSFALTLAPSRCA